MATAKIAALLAWQQKSLSNALKGSGAGALLGELLKKIGPLPDFDQKPPPAKRPFPWESQAYSPDEKAPKDKSTHKLKTKPSDKPLKQLLKLLT